MGIHAPPVHDDAEHGRVRRRFVNAPHRVALLPAAAEVDVGGSHDAMDGLRSGILPCAGWYRQSWPITDRTTGRGFRIRVGRKFSDYSRDVTVALTCPVARRGRVVAADHDALTGVRRLGDHEIGAEKGAPVGISIARDVLDRVFRPLELCGDRAHRSDDGDDGP